MALMRYGRERIPSLFRDIFGDDLLAPSEGSETRQWLPEVDVYEENGVLKLEAELPGVKKDDVKLEFQDGVLTMSGERQEETRKEGAGYYARERRQGSFARSFRIGQNYDIERISAGYTDGILKVEIPKKEEVRPRQIKVE